MSSGKITATVLNSLAALLVLAAPYRGTPEENLSVEQARQVQDAERALVRLKEIDLDQLDIDAQARYGDLMSAAKGLTMKEVGPVADAFRKDKSAISTIMGPYGSAKTTTCFQKILNSILWQPTCSDGVKRARWLVVRDTYGHLETNVMADWFMWFPKTKENYNLRQNTHKLRFDIPVGNDKVVKLELEMLFRAIDDKSAEELAKGLSLTGVWFNEMDTLDFDAFKFLFPRCGRYKPPGMKRGGWSGAIGDMNAPDNDNWSYDFNVNKNIGLTKEEMSNFRQQFGENFKVSFHIQPGGLEPNAENKDNLPIGYYERLQIGMTEQEKSRFIHNKFGAVRNGNPVYSGYNDTRHCLEDMKADPRLPIHFGVDGGSTPAVVFKQKGEDGQRRNVDEVVIFQPDESKGLQKMGAKEFGQTVGEYWNENYSGFSLGIGWGDPSAWFDDGTKNAEDRAWIHKFVSGFNEKALGVKLKMKPAPVKRNLIGTRLECIRDSLAEDINGSAGLVISSRCKVLRQAYNSGYVTIRVQYSTGGGRWKDDPVKNDFSHVADADQYGELGLTKFEGWEDAETGQRRRDRGQRKSWAKKKFGGGYFSPSGNA